MTICVKEYKEHLIENLNKISKFAKYYSYREYLKSRMINPYTESENEVYFSDTFIKRGVIDNFKIKHLLKYENYIIKNQVFLKINAIIHPFLFKTNDIPNILKFFDSFNNNESSNLKIDILISKYSDSYIGKYAIERAGSLHSTINNGELEMIHNSGFVRFIIRRLIWVPDEYIIGQERAVFNTSSCTLPVEDFIPQLYSMLKKCIEINSIFNENLTKNDIKVAMPYSTNLDCDMYIAELMYNNDIIPIDDVVITLPQLIKAIKLYPTYFKVNLIRDNEKVSLYLSNNPDKLEEDINYIKEHLEDKISFIWENCDIHSSRFHKEMQLHFGWNYIGEINKENILQVLIIAKQVLEDKITQCVNDINKQDL